VRLALVDRLRALSVHDRAAILGQFTAEQIASLKHCWPFWARPDTRAPGAAEGMGQLAPPPPWTWWANIGGRGSGKTRSCAEWVNAEAMRLGRGCVFHFLGATIDDARATMVEGTSGVLACAPPWAFGDTSAAWRPSVMGGTLLWKSGARARCFGADKPAKGRGPACNRFWIDDPAAFGPHGQEVLDQLLYGFRERAPDGTPPRGVISSTPIDSEILRWIMSGAEGKRQSKMVFSRSITDDNRGNLAPEYFSETLAEFAGTELEQQERFGRLDLANTPKVFSGIAFDAQPVRVEVVPERLDLLVVSIDPADSSSTRACEVGIIAGGLANTGHGYLLEDASGHLNSDQWPDAAWDLVERWADRCSRWRFVVEINRGTKDCSLLRARELIRRLQRGLPGVSVCEIRTVTSRVNKAERAASLPLIYRAGQMHHARGLVEVERQLRALDNTGRGLLDRADAAVYCELDLFGLLDSSQPGQTIGGASMPFAALGPRPQQAVAVGPMPSQGPRMTAAAPFQSAAMPGQVRR
jgi:phage terminase large subunit-like protein